MQEAVALQIIDFLGIEPWKRCYVGEKAQSIMPRLTYSREMFIERCKVHIRLSVEAHNLVLAFTPERSRVGQRRVRVVNAPWCENTGSPEEFLFFWEKVKLECGMSSDRDLLEAVMVTKRSADRAVIDRCRRVASGELPALGSRNQRVHSILYELRRNLWHHPVELLCYLSPSHAQQLAAELDLRDALWRPWDGTGNPRTPW